MRLAIVFISRSEDTMSRQCWGSRFDGDETACNGNDDNLMGLSALFQSLCQWLWHWVVACGGECRLIEHLS